MFWIGLSMGGMVGQGLAIRHPELVRGLVIANSASRYPDAARPLWAERIAKVEQGGLEAIADMVIERYFSAGFRAAQPDIVAAYRRQLLQTDPAGYAAACPAVRDVDWLDRLASIRCPTLVIAGREDVGAPVALSEAMQQRIPGAELVVIDEAAHLSVVEQPAAFGAAIDRFLARVGGAGAREWATPDDLCAAGVSLRCGRPEVGATERDRAFRRASACDARSASTRVSPPPARRSPLRCHGGAARRRRTRSPSTARRIRAARAPLPRRARPAAPSPVR